ncbi:MAG: hypothetical protein P8M25_20760 [Paracoccaceae bacterium]|nr:hypothetical protein [Paracoccaceae bacterium]
MWYEFEPKVYAVLKDFFPNSELSHLEKAAEDLCDEYAFSESFKDLWEKDLPPGQDKKRLQQICRRLDLCIRDLDRLGVRGNTSLEKAAKLFQPGEVIQLDLTRNYKGSISSILQSLSVELKQAGAEIVADNKSIFLTDEMVADLKPVQGRRRQITEEKVALHLAELYYQIVGKLPSITVDPYASYDQHTGQYHRLTEAVFCALELKGKATHSARKAIERLKTEK